MRYLAVILLGTATSAASTIHPPFTSASILWCVHSVAAESCRGLSDGTEAIARASDNTAASLATTLSAPALGSQYTFSASAHTEFGVMKTSASGALLDPGKNTHVRGHSSAAFSDVLTIRFDDLSGTGYLSVEFMIDKAISSASGGLIAQPTLIALVSGPTIPDQDQGVIVSGPGLLILPHTFTFQYGQPFNFQADLSAIIGGGPGNGEALIDMADTANLARFRVFDSRMNEIRSPVVESGSGTSYPVFGLVPEPNSFGYIVIGTAFIALVYLQGRRRFLLHRA